MLNRRQFLQWSASAAAALTLAACQPTLPNPASPAEPAPAAQPAQAGGTLRIAITDSIAGLDPGIFSSDGELNLAYMIYSTLVRRNEGVAGTPLQPALAESWEVSEDAKSFTFHLRQGVTFHHGLALTATDVEYSIQRLLDPALGTGVAQSLTTLDKVEVVDDHTVRFQMKEPNVSLPFTLSGPGFQIVPHDRSNEQLAAEPAGTGPFQFVEHLPGERLTLQRFAGYWEEKRPYLDEVQLLTLPESASQIAALSSGTVDVILRVGIENLPTLASAPDVQVLESLQGVFPLFAMDVTQPPFDDVRVRQAFKHAIDRAGLQQTILQGRGIIVNDQPIMPGGTFHAEVPPLAYDVEKAKELLAEAGYPDGIEVTLSLAEVAPRISDTAVVIQEMVKAAGITMNLDVVPMGAYWSEHYLQAPFFVSFWNSNSEPDGMLSLAYTSTGPYNESKWADPAVETLITQARSESDVAQRLALYTDVQQQISQNGGVVIPYVSPILMAARANVQGLVAQNPIYTQDVWLAA
jgi:peptide/nickel transport system substrate-binding protein